MNAMRIARMKKGYNQTQFADVMNVSKTTVSNWETHKAIPNVRQIMQIHVKLELPLDELMEHFNKEE
jgi:transcriptional regulator with XRE-family HTH domain